jgi:hypothetical protein
MSSHAPRVFSNRPSTIGPNQELQIYEGTNPQKASRLLDLDLSGFAQRHVSKSLDLFAINLS